MTEEKPGGPAGEELGASEPAPTRTTVSMQDLIEALERIVKKGLPTNQETAGVLTRLRSVGARSVHPEDALSRLDALNELLPRLLAQLVDEQFQEAARILFGVAAGTRATSLTTRRRQAAEQLGYNVDHFRQDIESKIIEAVAQEIHRDLLRYRSRVKRAEVSLEPTGDTPWLDQTHFTAEEELISRIWAAVWELRAETIAHLRLQDQPGYQGQAEDHRQAALRAEERLRPLLKEYVTTYGPLIQHGKLEYAAEALERLAGWRA